MSNNYLDDNELLGTVQKGSYVKNQLKLQHLNQINKRLAAQNQELHQRIHLIQKCNTQLENTSDRQSILIKNLKIQNQMLKQKNQEISKQNQILLAKILIQEQLSIQAKKQAEVYIGRYQQKIIQLRQSLQLKQIQIQLSQEKLSAIKGLHLPMSTKNASRYTLQILKYESLIEEMIRQKNKQYLNDVEEVQLIVDKHQTTGLGTKFTKKSQIKRSEAKSAKNDELKKGKLKNPQYMGTDVRGNIRYMQQDGKNIKQQNQKYELIILRLHLQLRQLKRKYRQSFDSLSQLKSKDKVMKQGYHTLTKQLQKYRNQNIQLKIQIQHIQKKMKTQHQLYKNNSTLITQKILVTKQSSNHAFSSELSIQANLSDMKNNFKITSPQTQKYDTFDNKIHNFDEQIQNIEGILSLDSPINHKNNRRGEWTRKDIESLELNKKLSICQQNEDNDCDVSISLDASGFQAPQKSHHQISKHIISGLMDRKIL